MADVENQIVDYLYKSLLGRAAEDYTIENCSSLLRSGWSVDDLSENIIASPEYKALHGMKSEHPLAHLEAVWQEDRISFFTHRGQYRPLSLSIETVNICNNDCVICPYSSQTRRRQHMPMDLFGKIISQYTEIGGGPIGLTPMVGEVLLDKLLLPRLELMKSNTAISEVSALSNASMAHLYDDRELEEILVHFARFGVSVYGLDSDEFRVMTRKDEYNRFRHGLIRILAILGPDRVGIGIRHLKSRSQAEVYEWGEALAREAGVDPTALKINGTDTYANWGVFDTSVALPLDAKWSPPRVNAAQCALPLISAQILSDGTASFCGCANFNGDSELTIGNVQTMTLREMMASERVRRLWNWETCGPPEFCKSCTFHVPIDNLASLPQAFSDPLRTFGG